MSELCPLHFESLFSAFVLLTNFRNFIQSSRQNEKQKQQKTKSKKLKEYQGIS